MKLFIELYVNFVLNFYLKIIVFNIKFLEYGNYSAFQHYLSYIASKNSKRQNAKMRVFSIYEFFYFTIVPFSF